MQPVKTIERVSDMLQLQRRSALTTAVLQTQNSPSFHVRTKPKQHRARKVPTLARSRAKKKQEEVLRFYDRRAHGYDKNALARDVQVRTLSSGNETLQSKRVYGLPLETQRRRRRIGLPSEYHTCPRRLTHMIHVKFPRERHV
jgi:hypothetical protein